MIWIGRLAVAPEIPNKTAATAMHRADQAGAA
jgi:hypothetical protein